MKQLLFLLLFPCLALAQYTGNAGQKISLGEQTTADGLVFRGLAADTTRKPSVDTMAYILLDTNTNIIWQYKKATNNAWTRLNLTQSDTTSFNYVNTYGTQTVNGAKTFTSDIIGARFRPSATTASGTGMFTPTSTSLGFSTNGTNRMTLDNRGNIGVATTPNTDIYSLNRGFQFPQGGSFLARTDIPILFFGSNIITNETVVIRQVDGRGVRFVANSLNGIAYDFWVEAVPYGVAGTNATAVRKISLENNGNFGIGDDISMTQKLDVDGNARIRSVGSGAYGNILNITSDGTLTTAASSDINFKYNINPISYGLETILKLKPVSYQWINGDEYDLGFIAQDAVNVIPEAVDTFHDSSLLFRYNTIIPILTKAIQEQNALIKALEQRILILENK
jgi:hypothetical protein